MWLHGWEKMWNQLLRYLSFVFSSSALFLHELCRGRKCYQKSQIPLWLSHRCCWQLGPEGLLVWMSCMFTLCVSLAGQKTIFPQYILSFHIFSSVCHCLSSYPSASSLPFLSVFCPLSLVEPSPHRRSLSCLLPLMLIMLHPCVYSEHELLCQKRSILFIQSKHGPGCWMPCDSFTHTHTHTRPQEQHLQYLVVPVESSWMSQWTKSTQRN